MEGDAPAGAVTFSSDGLPGWRTWRRRYRWLLLVVNVGLLGVLAVFFVVLPPYGAGLPLSDVAVRTFCVVILFLCLVMFAWLATRPVDVPIRADAVRLYVPMGRGRRDARVFEVRFDDVARVEVLTKVSVYEIRTGDGRSMETIDIADIVIHTRDGRKCEISERWRDEMRALFEFLRARIPDRVEPLPPHSVLGPWDREL